MILVQPRSPTYCGKLDVCCDICFTLEHFQYWLKKVNSVVCNFCIFNDFLLQKQMRFRFVFCPWCCCYACCCWNRDILRTLALDRLEVNLTDFRYVQSCNPSIIYCLALLVFCRSHRVAISKAPALCDGYIAGKQQCAYFELSLKLRWAFYSITLQ